MAARYAFQIRHLALAAWIVSCGLHLAATTPAAAGTIDPQAAVERATEPSGSSPFPEIQANKNCYTLFNPTPPSLMRPFEPDRPDQTESPYTIDAGHFAVEMGLVSYTHNDTSEPGRLEEGLVLAENNYKVGLLNNVDFQVIVQSFVWQRVEGRRNQPDEENSGLGDTEVRLKVNLCGNDGGPLAVALLPYAKLPTNQDGIGNPYVEGGLLVPVAIEGPMGFHIGLMTGPTAAHDATGSGYHPEWINSLVFHHELFIERLDGYVEFYSSNAFGDESTWIATVDTGLIYALTKNLMIDAGVNTGVTSDADDVNPFAGLSIRF